MLFGETCRETVSIIEALLLETGDACVRLDIWSILGGVFVFIALVVVLRFLGASAINKAFASSPSYEVDESSIAAPTSKPETLNKQPYKSPIESTGAWGGEKH